VKIYVATHNKHKISEISEILHGFEVVADNPAGVEETASDFAGNALIKVRAIAASHPGEWCMADDSGLEVEALGGAPGVFSARYAGGDGDTAANNALLLKNLEGEKNRRANFTCTIALVDPSGREHVVDGKVFGKIALNPSGAKGFGYDPLFIPDGYDKSFADLSAEEKNAISHRGRALAKAVEIINPRKKSRLKSFLDLFRVVNLPTVPGDVFVGVAIASLFVAQIKVDFIQIAAASAAAVFLYMFGLVDNDIAGFRTDTARPIPEGRISLGAARIARFLCIGAVIAVAKFFNLPSLWAMLAFVLITLIVFYNRTKFSAAMGLCRAVNLLCGAVLFLKVENLSNLPVPFIVAVSIAAYVWFMYIFAVTWYSKGEETDPLKKRFVGKLVGGLVYLQLSALIFLAYFFPKSGSINALLISGGVMLVLSRILKMLFPKVSAS
jgi:XTP/dITP diphosphohydrolase